MRCPKCDTTNSEFANACLKCGFSFVKQATYEQFVPDYPVAPQPPPAPGTEAYYAQQAAQQTTDAPDTTRLRKAGTAMMSLGIVLCIVGVVIGLILPSLVGGGGTDLDEWVKDAKLGDQTTIEGTVESTSSSSGGLMTVYTIKLEEYDTELIAIQDPQVEPKDKVRLTIGMGDGEPVVGKVEFIKNTEFIVLFILFLLAGVLIIVFGLLRIRKAGRIDRGEIRAAPAAPPSGQPQPQQPAQPQYQQPPAQRPPPGPAPQPQPQRPAQPQYQQPPAQRPPPGPTPQPQQPVRGPPPGAAPQPQQPVRGPPPGAAPQPQPQQPVQRPPQQPPQPQQPQRRQ